MTGPAALAFLHACEPHALTIGILMVTPMVLLFVGVTVQTVINYRAAWHGPARKTGAR